MYGISSCAAMRRDFSRLGKEKDCFAYRAPQRRISKEIFSLLGEIFSPREGEGAFSYRAPEGKILKENIFLS